jgi:ATP-dependent protease HslVU (ClpYQ) peptidase subunit
MVNAIAIMVLIAVATRIYKIRQNGGVTDIATEVFEIGSHLILSFIFFGFFMFILA